MQAIANEAAAHGKQQEQQEEKQRKERHDEWAERAIANGGKAAHRAAKEDVKTENPQGKDAAGQPTGCPYQVLLQEVRGWDEIWNSDADPGEIAQALAMIAKAIEEQGHSMRRITAADVREASKSFKRCTATPDGFHPRTFMLLSEAGQQLVADLLNLFESTGLWAKANSTIHMKVTKKPQGGKRLIGWYRALFRLWCAIRSDEWREWEAKYATETYFGASRGNSVVDVGWRQAARSEIAQISGRHVVLVAQDLQKCYEFIRHHILAAEAIELHFPLRLLYLTIQSYGWSRNLIEESIIACGIYANRGMVAGCIAATRELKAYMSRTLGQIVIRNPRVEIDSWVDDLTIEAEDDDEKRLRATVAKAVADLRTTAKAELCLEFAELKTTVVASRDRLATRVAGTVGSEKAKAKGKTVPGKTARH